jgi:hypothetical protein
LWHVLTVWVNTKIVNYQHLIYFNFKVGDPRDSDKLLSSSGTLQSCMKIIKHHNDYGFYCILLKQKHILAKEILRHNVSLCIYWVKLLTHPRHVSNSKGPSLCKTLSSACIVSLCGLKCFVYDSKIKIKNFYV